MAFNELKFGVWVKSFLLEMCSMCNTRDGKVAWNCIKYLCYSMENG